ncbi:MAG: carbohydrate ABC transporter permease [Candidatus Sumerlaeaceae bacterium]|nr:carbohydrate ABC transporter permease [Candidatus Sumerlaeaceae bacterium]
MMSKLLYAYVAYWTVVAVWTLAKNPRTFATHVKYNVLTIGAFIMALPFYWMVITSLKSYGEAQHLPPIWWPEKLQWGNYPEAWNKPVVSFGRYYFVSGSTAIVSTIGVLATALLAAYAFAKMNFYGKGIFFYIVLATIMVPGEVLLTPNYIMLSKLGWLDSYKALVVPWLASVFSIFLMRQFFMTIPDDLWDAAQIDGAGRWRFLWRVLVPLSKPVLITSGIFSFISSWNSLLWPLIVTSKPEMRTLMVGLQVFTNEAQGDYHLMMAAATFCIFPIVVIFFFMQRFFIEGIARSGLKS